MDPEPSPKEKHDIWIKNSGYLYDRLVVHPMKWPSLTFQWLPTLDQDEDGTISYQFLIGTHTSGRRSQEFLQIMKLQLPELKDIEDTQPYVRPSKITKVSQFKHEVQINRARHCPFNPSLVAARIDNAPITLYKRGNQYPIKILTNHTFQSGFALEWNNFNLIAGDYDGSVMIWQDIDEQKDGTKINCGTSINDIKVINHNSFVTVGDEGIMGIWDNRTGKQQGKVLVSQKQVYAADINKTNENLVLAGGEDSVVRLFDLRSYNQKLYAFQNHQDKVLNVKWSAKNPTVFASGSQDTKVKIWDILRVGFEIPKDHSGTQQLLFTHEGHQGEVLDLDWNPHCMLLGSCQEYHNTVQIYEIANCIEDIEYVEDLQFLRDQCLS